MSKWISSKRHLTEGIITDKQWDAELPKMMLAAEMETDPDKLREHIRSIDIWGEAARPSQLEMRKELVKRLNLIEAEREKSRNDGEPER